MDGSWRFSLVLILLIVIHLNDVLASVGDRLTVHRNLLRSCLNHNCSSQQQLHRFHETQPLELWMLGWDCVQECRYQSMWRTVDHLIAEGSSISAIPQFYGKWPFIRIFGVQEPASVIFSIGNGLAQVFFMYKLRKQVPSSAPMYYVGLAQALIAINAWIWSSVFHSRDLDWTEKMDYFCAYSIVMCCLMTSLLRIFAIRDNSMNMKVSLGIVVLSSIFYLRHVCFLTFIHFDYGYNMKVNVITAIFNFVLMVVWSLWNIRLQPYLWKAIASVVSLNVCILLELLDFPPVWWMFDAHSLWHASTIPIVFLYASFFVDDCLFLHNKQVKLKKGA